MFRPVKLFEVLIALIPIVGSILTVYLNLRDSDIRTQLRLNQIESNYQKLENIIMSNQEKTERKLDAMNDSQTTIRILLENKENRQSNYK